MRPGSRGSWEDALHHRRNEFSEPLKLTRAEKPQKKKEEPNPPRWEQEEIQRT
jgi:hypothetical protein